MLMSLLLIGVTMSGIDFTSKFWCETFDRGLIILLFAGLYFPACLYFIKKLDLLDPRYMVEFVKEDPVANGVYAGIREGCLIIAAALVFTKIITVCLL